MVKMIRRATGIILIFMLVSATACARMPMATPPPTPQIITVSIPTSLEPMVSSLQDCARDQPDIALFIEHPEAIGRSEADLRINLGAPSSNTGYSLPLAMEILVVVLNEETKIEPISVETLRTIYSGKITSWDKLGAPAIPIQVWDYPAQDFLHQVFDQAVLKGSLVTGQANIAPSPAEMLASIRTNPGAIGYLPGAWLSGSDVYAIKLDPENMSVLRLPVVAVANNEPQGALRTFSACLQTGKGRAEIMKHYLPITP